MSSINIYKVAKTSVFLLTVAFLLTNCKREASDLEKLELKDLDGTRIDLSSYKDKIVFVNFWATWCKPCIQEMPTIVKAQEALKDENVVFLFPSNESVELIQEFKEKRSFNFDYLQVTNLEALNIQALPTTMIFNAKGERIFSEAGFRDWSTAENLTLITEAQQP